MTALEEIQTSLRLIHELLELARAEAGEIEIECVRTDVSVLACEAADDVRAQAATKGLRLEVRVPDGLEAVTDAARVRQVLSNLLSNAVKYTAAGSVTVEARSDAQRGRVAVTVSDTGAGVPADKQEAIFQEFTRLDPEAQPGAGVGLAIQPPHRPAARRRHHGQERGQRLGLHPVDTACLIELSDRAHVGTAPSRISDGQARISETRPSRRRAAAGAERSSLTSPDSSAFAPPASAPTTGRRTPSRRRP